MAVAFLSAQRSKDPNKQVGGGSGRRPGLLGPAEARGSHTEASACSCMGQPTGHGGGH